MVMSTSLIDNYYWLGFKEAFSFEINGLKLQIKENIRHHFHRIAKNGGIMRSKCEGKNGLRISVFWYGLSPQKVRSFTRT
jgi:hypothetical protein